MILRSWKRVEIKVTGAPATRSISWDQLDGRSGQLVEAAGVGVLGVEVFDDVRSEGAEMLVTSVMSPKANAYAAR